MIENLNAVLRLLNWVGDVHWQAASTMLLQVCVLVAILLCVDFVLRRWVRPVFRYWMWTLVLVKLVLPVTLVCPISPAYWLAGGTLSKPAPTAIVDAPSRIPDRRTVVVPHVATVDFNEGGARSFPAQPDRAAETHNPGTTDDSPRPASLQPVSEPAVPVELVSMKLTASALLAWLTAVSGLTVLLGRRVRKVQQLVRRADPAGADLCELLDACHRLVRLQPGTARVKLSEELGTPAICGLWKPTILLPRTLARKLDSEQLRLVFVHELAHWKRGDLQVQWLQTVLQIVYFYNPAVWIANAILRRLREDAVDETVLVAAAPHSDVYSSTLLDVAELARRPAELALRLTGVVESRKALTQRIRRMAQGRIPKSARLGLSGVAAILVMGLVLLPMSGRKRSNAEAPQPARVSASAVEEPGMAGTQPKNASEPPALLEEAFTPQGVLSGRITDQTGSPVTDAKLSLTEPYGRVYLEVQSDQRGFYHFDEVPRSGEYQVRLQSSRCIGLTHPDETPRIHLAPGSEIVRHFTLNRACRLRVRTVDRDGKPVARVMLCVATPSQQRMSVSGPISTDKQGLATIGGLKPSESDYLVGASSGEFGFARLEVRLDDPEKIVARELVLDKGVAVTGKVLCSDGQPPAGWRISALPTWWDFGVYPSGQVIGPDGSFTLPHIVRDEYNITVSIPSNRGGGSSPKTVLASATLPPAEGPLSLTLDHPSPASMASISGKIRYVGGPIKKGFWIFANSQDRQYHGSVYVQPEQEEFEVAPVPRALYNIQFESPEIEAQTLRGVAAPVSDLEVTLTVRGKPALRGTAVRGDTREPIRQFRVRVTKLRTLRGPNYIVEPRWHEVENPEGRFEVEVPGPGIYVVQVAADGFAYGCSEPIDTDKTDNEPVRIELSEGVSLSGTVVDEEGKPIDGARVTPASKASGMMAAGQRQPIEKDLPESILLRLFTTADGAISTVKGRFTIEHLVPGNEILKVTHPDYCVAIVRNVPVGGRSASEATKITLARGGTVRGHVYDEFGRPAAGATIVFQDDAAGGPGDEAAGRLATARTDESGFYEARHLPERICTALRGDKWQNPGVTVQTILPRSGRTQTLDFGGRSKLTGRLTVNGKALANAPIVLSGESPNFGVFRANAHTAADGSFTFWGPQPGKRTLYYAVSDRLTDWVRVKDLRVTSQETDLGTIDQQVCRVVVRSTSEGGTPADVRVTLQEYDPIWTHGNSVGIERPRQRPDAPFVFDFVPPGKYELLVSRPEHLQIRKLVEVQAASREKEVTCSLPAGTASLAGKLDGEICGPGGCSALKLWSKDGSRLGYIIPKPDGTYRLDHLPPGDYAIREKDTRNAPVVFELSLSDNESRNLDLTLANISLSAEPLGFLVVRIFTPDGVPLPCDVKLTGASGPLPPHSSQYARQGFVGPPGTYELSVDYPGYQPLRRTVELKPVGPGGRAAEGSEVHFHLLRQ